MEKRFIKLEETAAQQEYALEKMHAELCRQQEDIRALKTQIELLKTRLNDLASRPDESGTVTQERPPHY